MLVSSTTVPVLYILIIHYVFLLIEQTFMYCCDTIIIGMEFDRRDFVKTVGTGAIVGFSGCMGDSGGEYPSRSMRSIVSFGAGGGADRYTRKFAKAISENTILDVEFEVENMGGGGGLSGMSATYNSEPDGYTFGCTAPPIPNISAIKNPPDFDLLDLEQICRVGEIPGLLITHSDYNIEDFGEMVEKYEAGEFSNIGTGWGTMGEILLELLSQQGLKYESVITYGGAGPASKAVLNKEVPLAVASDAGMASAVEGDAQALAVLSESGSKVFPEVPPITEFDFSSLPFSGVGIGYRAPPETPSEKVQTLANAFEEASKTDEIQQWSKENGLKVTYKGPEETSSMMEELDKAVNEYSEMIKGE